MFAAFGVLALLMIAALCVQVGGAVVARHRAQASADLAALAAAGALADGGDACTAARTLAQSNRARIGSCRIEGQTVVVQAVVSLPMQGIAGIGPSAADAVARAGWKIG